MEYMSLFLTFSSKTLQCKQLNKWQQYSQAGWSSVFQSMGVVLVPAGAVTPHQNPHSERFTKPWAPAEEFVQPWAGKRALIFTSSFCEQPQGEGEGWREQCGTGWGSCPHPLGFHAKKIRPWCQAQSGGSLSVHLIWNKKQFQASMAQVFKAYFLALWNMFFLWKLWDLRILSGV